MDRITVNGVEYVRVDSLTIAPAPAPAPAPAKRVPQPRMVERKCAWCKGPFLARAADVQRGWGKFCSKACKAKEQEKRTGQNRAYVDGRGPRQDYEDKHRMHEEAMHAATAGWDEGGWCSDESGVTS